MHETLEKQSGKWTRTTWLILLCWLVYACSYIGKLSYSANIAEIEKHYAINYKTAGAVTTFFFFAYGAGQVINGLLCKKYNLKYVVFGSLLVSGVANLLAAVVQNFAFVKYLWLINGASMSVLWPSLIRLLSENLDKKDVARAVVIMGTTVATGTFLVYGMSALFVALGNFRITFFVAATLLPTIAFVWFIFEPKLTLKNEGKQAEEEKLLGKEERALGGFVLASLCVLALFAVVNNFVKDGLTTWTPDILASLYGLQGWTSILLTLLLPLLAIFGTVVATALHKRIKSFVGICMLFFGVSALLIATVILLLTIIAVPITIACFAVVACLMAGVNNVITSMTPLSLKGRANSGMIAGLLNGFCYLGSTLSSYGLGSVADAYHWSAVFYLLLACCVLTVAVGACLLIVQKSKKKEFLG